MVIFWHLIFSVLAMYLSTIVFPFQSYWHIHITNLLAILLLWFYSTSFKKKFLIGNVIIAILTAWSIAIVYFSKFTVQEITHPAVSNASILQFAKVIGVENITVVDINPDKEKSALYRKYLENYQRALSSRDVEKYVDGEADVVDMEKIINEFALLRNQWLGIIKGIDQKYTCRIDFKLISFRNIK